MKIYSLRIHVDKFFNMLVNKNTLYSVLRIDKIRDYVYCRVHITNLNKICVVVVKQ